MSFRLLTALSLICGAGSTIQAQYPLPTHYSAPTTGVTAVAAALSLSVPKPIAAAQLHQSLVEQRGRTDRQRGINQAHRHAARRMLARQFSLSGQWDVLSADRRFVLHLADGGYTLDDGATRRQGVWRHETRPHGFVLSMHAAGQPLTTLEGAWTVRGRQFKLIHPGTGVVYTVTRR